MTGQVKKKIEKLREEIRKHNYLYYVKAEPVISDRHYDMLYRRLQELEEKNPRYDAPDSPTKRVGSQVLEGFETVTHRRRMLSLDNVYSREELRQWEERVKKKVSLDEGYIVEEKIDGMGVSLTYENGILTLGATRGNGRRGDNITPNIKTQKVIPLRLDTDSPPGLIEIRGEMFLSISEFRRINSRRKKEGKSPFANPRNTCAGTLKLLDPSRVAKRRLSAFFYAAGEWQGKEKPHTQQELLETLTGWGLPVDENCKICKDLQEVFSVFEKLSSSRDSRDYEVDGAVIKVNSIQEQHQMGTTAKSPRWAIAYKYEAKKEITTITGVQFGVGRTGKITPVARLEPVKVGGVTISKATLHNFDYISRIGAGVGDRVEIERGGEVIPKILGVKTKSPRSKEIVPPPECPSCGGELKQDPGGVYLRCVNISCPAQLKQRIIHYGGPGAMNIEGLGEKVAHQLVENKLVKRLPDLYSLDMESLLDLDLFAQKKARKLLEEIKKSKDCRLETFIWALGIREVGRHTAALLAEEFRDIQALFFADKNRLQSIDEIGPVVAENIFQFFSARQNKKTVQELLEKGVRPVYEEKESSLEAKTFVFTGALKEYSRKEAESAVELKGARATSSVSSRTDFLVKGENPGSKLTQAQEHNVNIISEEEFKRMVLSNEK